jgi:hypothetical protein
VKSGYDTVNPIVRARILALITENPGATEDELTALDGGNVLARLRVQHTLHSLRGASLARRDDFGRWWA